MSSWPNIAISFLEGNSLCCSFSPYTCSKDNWHKRASVPSLQLCIPPTAALTNAPLSSHISLVSHRSHNVSSKASPPSSLESSFPRHGLVRVIPFLHVPVNSNFALISSGYRTTPVPGYKDSSELCSCIEILGTLNPGQQKREMPILSKPMLTWEYSHDICIQHLCLFFLKKKKIITFICPQQPSV